MNFFDRESFCPFDKMGVGEEANKEASDKKVFFFHSRDFNVELILVCTSGRSFGIFS